MAYEYTEYPDLNYSHSRIKLLEECLLKYFYNYYLYHNGWLMTAEERIKQAYRLKCLQNIDMVTGTAIHKTIQEMILNNKYENSDALQRSISKKIKKFYNDAKENIKNYHQSPKRYPTLFEVYYFDDIDKKKKEEINEKVVLCSKNISTNDIIIKVREKELEVIELDELKSFNFYGIFTVFLKIDLLARDRCDNYYILDWKTGNKFTDEHIRQLLLYTYYVSKTYGIPINQIESQLVYLPLDKNITFTFDDEDIDSLEKKIFQDYEILRGYIKEGTVNTPISEDNFKRTNNSRCCQYCNFNEMCI